MKCILKKDMEECEDGWQERGLAFHTHGAAQKSSNEGKSEKR